MIQGEASCMKQLKLWMLLSCFALGFDSSEEKKCCVSRAYAVCWVTPNFCENALTDEKKKLLLPQHLQGEPHRESKVVDNPVYIYNFNYY